MSNFSNTCGYCGSKISDEELETKSRVQRLVNQACNDANNLKFLGTACLAVSVPRSVDDVLFGYFTNSYINYFPHGLILLFLFFLTRWLYNFGGLQTNDEDFIEAKRKKNVGVFLWFLSVLLVFLVVPLIENFVFSLF